MTECNAIRLVGTVSSLMMKEPIGTNSCFKEGSSFLPCLIDKPWAACNTEEAKGGVDIRSVLVMETIKGK